MQISNNGILSFRIPFRQFSPSPFPNGVIMIAPFWGDVDTRNSSETPPPGVPREEIGMVWFREEFNSELLDKAGREVREAFVGLSTFIPTSLFIATWSNVGYFSVHIDKVNKYCNKKTMIYHYHLHYSAQHLPVCPDHGWTAILCLVFVSKEWDTVGFWRC